MEGMEGIVVTFSDKLGSTRPETYSAIVDLAVAYEKIWAAVDKHPADSAFVGDLLTYIHGASVIPHMERLKS
jgi:hypothetical protein